MPDWRFQPSDFSAHGFMNSLSTDSLSPNSTDSNGSNLRKSAQSADEPSALPNSRKVYVAGEIHRDMRVPFFVIPSKVEGSLDISVRL
jgi:hypothetical protein